VFPNDATSYPYNAGLAIGGTSGNLLWKGSKVAVEGDIPTASSDNPLMDGSASAGSGTQWSRKDHRHPTDTTRAPLASPTLTGTPKAPTAAAGTNTTQIATTAFVKTAIDNSFKANDAMIYKGAIAGTSTSPGAYTAAADAGHTYKVSAAGYINGQKVQIGDMLICCVDSTAAATSSNYTTVMANWNIIQSNVDVMQGAKSGASPADGATGLVPAPTQSDASKFLRGDGTWASDNNSSHAHSAGVGLTVSGNAGISSGTSNYKVNLVNEAKSTNAATYTAGGTSKFYAVQLDANDKLGVYVPWTGDITGVAAGNGLTGGGNSGSVTLNVGEGNGISVAADTVSAKAGSGITVDANGINHADTSSAANLTANGRKYVTGLTFDTYGHVTGYTTGTETVVNTHAVSSVNGKTGAVSLSASDVGAVAKTGDIMTGRL
jgi:hypothetical protein